MKRRNELGSMVRREPAALKAATVVADQKRLLIKFAWALLGLFLLSTTVIFGFQTTVSGGSKPIQEGGPLFLCDNSGRNNRTGGKMLEDVPQASTDEEKTCLSMVQMAFYRKKKDEPPSDYLVQRLERYKAYHNKCAPYTESYNKTIHQLRYEESTVGLECHYLIWTPNEGLGNQLTSLVSTFLYALLANRVLLVTRNSDLTELFCEPFPGTTWLLPSDFPIFRKLNVHGRLFPYRYSKRMRRNVFGRKAINGSTDQSLPIYIVHSYLGTDYTTQDKLFFRQDDQFLLKKFPLMVISSNMYYAPPLFTIPMFQEELDRLFPKKDTVFFHVSRFLLYPSNPVWDLVTRHYQSHLAGADVRIGMQIRNLIWDEEPFHRILRQVFFCISREKLLPEVDMERTVTTTATNATSTAVLLTSLSSWYFDRIKSIYCEHPTLNGQILSVYQPSHAERQQTNTLSHDMQALAEIYLLSLTDVLITTARSTFGYIAHGLGMIRPWVLQSIVSDKWPEPICRRDISSEPCFHRPLNYRCRSKPCGEYEDRLPHVKHCVDLPIGVKLVHHQ